MDAGTPDPETHGTETVTDWIVRLKQGDASAARQIWNRYFDRLTKLAERRLLGAATALPAGDDVALESLNALFEGAQAGRFTRLDDRDDLWQVLTLIACRRASNARRSARARKDVAASASGVDLEMFSGGLAPVVDTEPNDQWLGGITAACSELLGLLDVKLKRIAISRLQGYTNMEIATQRACSVKSVERYMRMIRERWAD